MRRWGVALLVAAACLAHADTADAHGAALIVSRDSTARPQLRLNGPSDYLEGGRAVVLLKADGDFLGSWLADAPGIATLREDGMIRDRLRLRTGHRLALELVRADRGLEVLSPTSWEVLLARPGQTYEFHRDEHGDFSIQMISRAKRPGTLHATFRFVDLARLHRPSEPFTLAFRTDTVPDLAALTPLVPPASYRDAIAELRLRFHDADAWIPVREFVRITDDAQAMESLAVAIPRLVRADSSGVPVSSHAAVASQASAALAAATALHRAADFSDSSGAREHFEALRSPLDAFESFIPPVYTCPMGDLNGKTYAAAGWCPVCGMELMDSRAHLDHTPKHGGVFLMSPDFRYHLEAVLDPHHELRVYFYDAFTKPIAADAIRAHVVLPASGAGRTIALAPAAGAASNCLAATLPSTVRAPTTLSLAVTFDAAHPEQSFDIPIPRPAR